MRLTSCMQPWIHALNICMFRTQGMGRKRLLQLGTRAAHTHTHTLFRIWKSPSLGLRICHTNKKTRPNHEGRGWETMGHEKTSAPAPLKRDVDPCLPIHLSGGPDQTPSDQEEGHDVQYDVDESHNPEQAAGKRVTKTGEVPGGFQVREKDSQYFLNGDPPTNPGLLILGIPVVKIIFKIVGHASSHQ